VKFILFLEKVIGKSEIHFIFRAKVVGTSEIHFISQTDFP
jgi:hypothetical protein